MLSSTRFNYYINCALTPDLTQKAIEFGVALSALIHITDVFRLADITLHFYTFTRDRKRPYQMRAQFDITLPC